MTKKLKSILLAELAIVIASPVLFAQRVHNGALNIVFEHYVDSAVLKLDSVVYHNALAQSFKVSNFKYYVSNFQLIKHNDTEEKLEEKAFLIREDESETKSFSFSEVKEESYIGIKFMIGVDSLHNCSGAQSGDLDPMNGMFWAWNTGYIFLKLEGTAPSSTAPGKVFEYHIGGYKQPLNCMREVVLRFEKPLIIRKDHYSVIKIKADIAEILKGPVNVDFSMIPVVTDQKNAKTIADNYSDIFTVIEIKE